MTVDHLDLMTRPGRFVHRTIDKAVAQLRKKM